jgi:hypothetical protein
VEPDNFSSGAFNPETAADSSRGPDPSGDALEYARALLASSREELVRADTKAALLLAASGIAIGALLNGLLGGKWSPSHLNNWVEWLWWLGIAATVVAIVSLASAIYPRTKRSSVKPLLVAYYADVVLLSREELSVAMAVTPAKINSVLVDQIYQISLIVSRKYKLFCIALWAFASAATFCAVSILINAMIPA